MPKRTQKYLGAVNTALNARLDAASTRNQEELYQLLQDNGYFWDSTAKVWEHHPIEQAAEPTPMIMVRLWANGEITSQAADNLIAALAGSPATKGWALLDRSDPYPCRPPKQKESRVYLKFLPGGEK